jgi:hypothetical protein
MPADSLASRPRRHPETSHTINLFLHEGVPWGHDLVNETLHDTLPVKSTLDGTLAEQQSLLRQDF